nr:MAG TPA: hypothetical protein [Caudoviricetes sp.]
MPGNLSSSRSKIRFLILHYVNNIQLKSAHFVKVSRFVVLQHSCSTKKIFHFYEK